MDDRLREALATLGQRIELADYERRIAVDAVRELMVLHGRNLHIPRVYLSNGLAAALPDVTDGSKDVGTATTFLNNQGWTNVVGDCDTAELTTPPAMIGKVYMSDPAPGSVVNKATVITLHWYKAGVCP